MKIKALTTIVSERGTIPRGTVSNLPKADALDMIERGAAVAVRTVTTIQFLGTKKTNKGANV